MKDVNLLARPLYQTLFQRLFSDTSYGLKRNFYIDFCQDRIVSMYTHVRTGTERFPVVVTDLERHLVTPGLIDCQTHFIFLGNRRKEFEQRLKGVSCPEIGACGGGLYQP